ncbi:hypothetical protein [Caulobacter radicis]|uniref:Uncharacterized protein n=2 Tax=Caulobacter TaxID=75 RepID=A0A2T9J7J9_9CAUL|nr:hypothetical protein [Caulobacter radicis]PVM77528.1 hypothetical protein DDF65_16525 [Caulobacter radicis]
MEPQITFTFVCLAKNQVASFVDVQALPQGAERSHALQLLRDHVSAATVEVWRDEKVCEVVARDGIRAAKPTGAAPTAATSPPSA